MYAMFDLFLICPHLIAFHLVPRFTFISHLPAVSHLLPITAGQLPPAFCLQSLWIHSAKDTQGYRLSPLLSPEYHHHFLNTPRSLIVPHFKMQSSVQWDVLQGERLITATDFFTAISLPSCHLTGARWDCPLEQLFMEPLCHLCPFSNTSIAQLKANLLCNCSVCEPLHIPSFFISEESSLSHSQRQRQTMFQELKAGNQGHVCLLANLCLYFIYLKGILQD